MYIVLSIIISPSECRKSVNISTEAIKLTGCEMSFIVSIPSIFNLLFAVFSEPEITNFAILNFEFLVVVVVVVAVEDL